LKELEELISLCQPQKDDTIIFIGDLINKGPDSVGVVRYVHGLSERYIVKLIIGNHEEKFLRYIDNLKKDNSAINAMTGIEGFAKLAEELSDVEIAFVKSGFFTLYLPDVNLLLLHGGIPGSCKLNLPKDYSYLDCEPENRKQLRLLTMTRYLDAKGNFVELGKEDPGTPFWAESYDGRFGKVIFGHHPFMNDEPRNFPNAIGIDSGCVFGGWLNACVLERDGSLKFINVKAHRVYAELQKVSAALPKVQSKNRKSEPSIGSSIMVIPLSIENPEVQIAEVKEKSILVHRNRSYDSSKYYSFMNYYLGEQGSKAFMQEYKIDLNKLNIHLAQRDNIRAGLPSEKFAICVSRSGSCNSSGDNLMEFSFNKISFFHNSQAKLGYFCIEFKWQEANEGNLLENLASTAFFRFIGKQHSKIYLPVKKAGSNSSKPYSSEDTNSGQPIFQDLDFKNEFLIALFPSLFCSITESKSNTIDPADRRTQQQHTILNSEKPVMMHIVRISESSNPGSRQRQAYQILRVPNRKSGESDIKTPLDNSDFISSIQLDTSIGIYLLNEGALILDKNEDVQALINKYFPTFLLALNQRQILIYMMELIATKIPSDIDNNTIAIANSKERRIAKLKLNNQISELENLRTHLIKLQLKQIFYSISHNDELNLFLTNLQSRFRITLLLQDIKESIGELHQLLEANQEFEQWQSEKRREIAINLVGLTISAFGIISTMDTIFSKNQASLLVHNTGYVIVALVSVLLGGWFWSKR
jgi:hypothetical protein